MADLLVGTDLRGVFSHGTQRSGRYLQLLCDRELNPKPEVRVERETPTTAVIDGDGGLGHLAAWQGARLAVEKAKATGLGAATTRNHHHFGAAGIYTRVASDAGLVGFAVSSHVRSFKPNRHITAAGGASPMSFAVPAEEGPPLVLDMASSLYPIRNADMPEIFGKMPGAFFKALGLGAVCYALGGALAGIVDVDASGPTWPSVNQGAFILAIDVSAFADPESFERQMSEFVEAVTQMQPFPGQERALLPGTLEWEHEREWSEVGIPVGPQHQTALEDAAREFDVAAPL
jgi:LDH2 family malate/lactate/ureidoglycolate dehydrogenase